MPDDDQRALPPGSARVPILLVDRAGNWLARSARSVTPVLISKRCGAGGSKAAATARDPGRDEPRWRVDTVPRALAEADADAGADERGTSIASEAMAALRPSATAAGS
jgi:hypothetical protein